MDLPVDFYKLFLQKVREIFELEAKKRKITLIEAKLNYWLAKDDDRVPLLHRINFGTTEVRHFYDRELQMRNKPKKDIEETDLVVISTLNIVGISLPEGLQIDEVNLLNKAQLRDFAELMFLNFLKKFHSEKDVKKFAILCDKSAERPINDADRLNQYNGNLNDNSLLNTAHEDSIETNAVVHNNVDKSALTAVQLSDSSDNSASVSNECAKEFTEFIKEHFNYIANGNFLQAFDGWHPKHRLENWSGDINKFKDSFFETLHHGLFQVLSLDFFSRENDDFVRSEIYFYEINVVPLNLLIDGIEQYRYYSYSHILDDLNRVLYSDENLTTLYDINHPMHDINHPINVVNKILTPFLYSNYADRALFLKVKAELKNSIETLAIKTVTIPICRIYLIGAINPSKIGKWYIQLMSEARITTPTILKNKHFF